jgi:hypothetical protein
MRRLLWACAFILLSAAAASAQGNCIVVNGVSQCASPWRIYDSTVRAISFPILDLSQTWNAPGVTFTGLKQNVTDTNSATASLLMDLQVGGTSKFSVSKAGAITSASTFTPTGVILGPSGTCTAGAIPYSFSGDTDTGVYGSSANVLGLCAGGTGIVLIDASGNASFGLSTGGGTKINGAAAYEFNTRTKFLSPADGQATFTNNAGTAGIGFDVGTDGTLKLRNRSITAGTGSLDIGAKVTAYNSVTTAGWGLDAVQGQATTGTVTNTGTASIATYTVGAADGVFRVSCDVSVTVSTTHSFSCDVTYTDVTSAARTLVLPMYTTAGAQLASNLIAASATGSFNSPVMQIRAKAATVITVRTSSGGTFTTVTYTASGSITQIG